MHPIVQTAQPLQTGPLAIYFLALGSFGVFRGDHAEVSGWQTTGRQKSVAAMWEVSLSWRQNVAS